MNRFWKWTLGMLGILIVLAILAIPLALHYRFGLSTVRGFDSWHGPMMQYHHGFGFERSHGSMMFGRGFGFGRGLFFVFGAVLKLAFLAALLYGAYWLGKRNARLVIDPAASPPAPAVEPQTPPGPGRKVV
jgi:hypothetical protein